MNRRDFIKSAAVIAIGSPILPLDRVLAGQSPDIPREFLYLDRSMMGSTDKAGSPGATHPQSTKPVFPVPKTPAENAVSQPDRAEIKLYLKKMRHFNRPHPDDVYIDADEMPLLHSSAKRLRRVRSVVGFGNFYLLSFDEARKFALQYANKVGPFTPAEINFLEKQFYTEAVTYGFFGDKSLVNFTHVIPRKSVARVPGTGNFLYKGPAVAVYDRIQKDIGPQAVLTSGVRSVMKQFDLFLWKTVKCNGNLSMASRSIAPPGYSYHGVSDFDIGKKGLGGANFTAKFTQTDVFKKMAHLDYLKIRYHQDNMQGVRFEPWHIKVDASG